MAGCRLMQMSRALTERYRLYNDAALAAQRSDWRACADCYRQAYEAVPQNSRDRVKLAYNCISGYTSVIRQEDITPTDSDLIFLKQLGKEEKAPAPVRVQAMFTLGFARWCMRDREGAARAYRKAIEVGGAVSQAERLVEHDVAQPTGLV